MKQLRKVISHALIVTLVAGSVIMPLNSAFAQSNDTKVTEKSAEQKANAEKIKVKGKQLIIKYKDQVSLTSKSDWCFWY